MNESSDIKRLLKRYGYTVRELPACDTWQDLLDMSKGKVFLDMLSGWQIRNGERRRDRLDREHLYLPGSFNYEEIEQQLKQLTDALGSAGADGRRNWHARRESCEELR